VKIGFIGQGWIGRNYADDFEHRGYAVVRYGLEPEYAANAPLIAECDIVFIAVPTPTTPDGFDLSTVRTALGVVGCGKVAVVKSTILPGSTEMLQKENPHLYLFHSPEFLTQATAAYDAANPIRNIVGTPSNSPEFLERATSVLSVLPSAPFTAIMPAAAAELVKYAGNCLLYAKVVFSNILYDLAENIGVDYLKDMVAAIAADPRIGESHLKPIHSSGRGAGGHCFIKDFAAFRQFYVDHSRNDSPGANMLRSIEAKNLQLLEESGKDSEIVRGVYAATLAQAEPKSQAAESA
jgi:UDPglucose 6-dehydrogenase